MKTFLKLCTFAMISAGIYGFIDMTADVRHGKMIQYDRGEKINEKPVTVERLKMAQGFKTSIISNDVAVIDLSDKAHHAKPEVAVVKPTISVNDFIGENYSRGEPVELVDADYFKPLVAGTPADTSRNVAPAQTVTEKTGTNVTAPVSPALVTTERPIYEITAAVDSLKTEEVAKPEPVFEFESYGRGNPGIHHKKPVAADPAPVADTTKVVVKKDGL